MFSEQTLGFLSDLRANNTREWFEANRKVYISAVRDAARDFAQALEQLLDAETGWTHQHKIFRMHRDLRFSKDKTPYNTHVHMSFIPAGGQAAWMVGLEPGKLTFGAGVMQFAPDQLDRWRARVDSPDGEVLTKVLDGLQSAGCHLPEPELKRVPSPFAKDHARADLLRRKGLTIWQDLAATDLCLGPDGPTRCMGELRRFRPVMEWLNG